MPQIGWLVKDTGGRYRRVSHERLMRYAASYPPGFDYTPEMLDGMFVHQERDYMSPTMLSGCPREVVLRRQTDYYVPLEYAWPAYRGTIGHAMMEDSHKNEPHAILERRISVDFVLRPSGETVTLRGTPDKILPEERLLIDYKTVNELVSAPKTYWIPQLSSYRWMLRQHGQEIDRAIIQQIGMMRPQRTEIELWDLSHTERWLNARLHRFRGAFDGTYDVEKLALPPPVEFVTDPDIAWKCVARNGKPAWCAVQETCMELLGKGV